MSKKNHSLSVLLLKSGITSPEHALKNPSSLQNQEIEVEGKKAVLYFKRTTANSPAWVNLFRPVVGNVLDSLKNSGCAAVLLTKRSDRLFAVTFGYGRTLLAVDCCEENFGLKVVLNSVDPEKLRSIDAHSLDAVPVQIRSQAGTATSLAEFGFDIERDLIYAATGQPKDATLGKQITGRDVVKVTIPLVLDDMGSLLDKLLVQYNATDYKENFGWIDNLAEVRDVALIATLDDAFGEKIKSKNFDRTWLALPEIFDWSDLEGYKYQRAKQGEFLDDIDWVSYLEFVGDSQPIEVKTFQKHRVLYISAASQIPTREWSIYKCAYCELDIDGRTYALNNGKWYRVNADFLAKLDEVIKTIPTSSLTLPDYNDKTEALYNERVHKGDSEYFALMDKKNISYGGGSSKIEFCDLYTTDRHLVHVKRYGGSSVLSHLFAQGLISARLLLGDVDFRKEVNKKLPGSHTLKNPTKKPTPSDFEVVYAIASKGGADSKLPLFSRINLRNSYRQLELLTIKASIVFIPMPDAEEEPVE